MRIPPLGAALALISAVSAASANWPAEGVAVYSGATNYPMARVDPDAQGGFVLPFDCIAGGIRYQKLRRVAPDGLLDPAWSATALGEPGAIASDGMAGYFVLQRGAPVGGSVYAYRLRHVLAGGAPDPVWPDSGALVSAQVLDASKPVVVPDATGGAYVLYEFWRDTPPTASAIRLAHVTSGGATAPGWPADGVLLLNNSFSGLAQGLAPDGTGGAFAVVASFFGSSVQLTAHHWHADGTVDPSWTVLGVDLGRWPFSAEPLRLVSHGTEASLVWRTGTPNAPTSSVLRFDASLGQGERWYAVVPMGTEVGGVDAFDDGFGGLYLFWHQRFPVSDLCGVRWSASGTLAPGWSDPGRSRLPDDAEMDRDEAWAAGPGQQGSVLFAWMDTRQGRDSIYVARRDGSGAMAADWPPEGQVAPIWDALHGLDSRGHVLAVRGDALGRGLLAWHTGSSANDLLYLTPVGPQATVGAPDGTAANPSLLSVAPNPARSGFTVTFAPGPPDQRTRLELLDAAGRRWRESSPDPGARQVRWALGAEVPPGLYFVRITQGDRQRTRRVAIVR